MQMTLRHTLPLFRRSLLATVLSATASVALAQDDWQRASPATIPQGRYDGAMAFDSAHNRTVLFGGVDSNFNGLNDTWVWDGATWTQLSPAASPPPRSATRMAFDAARGRILLFGGVDAGGNGLLGDTWEFDGTNWTELHPATHPSARNSHAMGYDSARSRVVLFGGSGGFGPTLSDTWEWDGTNWSNVTPATSPAGRYQHSIAYDPTRSRTVLFGGATSFDTRTDDTWEWDGTSWTQANPPAHPSARDSHAMVFDAVRGTVILFSGGESFGQFTTDTWEWNGTLWTQLSPATTPPGRVYAGLAQSPGCGRVVMFGGITFDEAFGATDTWEFGGATTSSLATVAPHAGSTSGGELVHLFGSGFTTPGDTTVEFGGVAASILSVSATQIDVSSPPGSGTVDVVVRNSVCISTLAGGYTYVAPEFAARYGNVNQGRGEREDVILINSLRGDDTMRELSLTRTTPFRMVAVPPSSRATARFAVWVWLGAPGAANLTAQPFSLGTAVFPTPLNTGQTPQPRRIFNNFDPRLGTANLPSTRAPSTLLNRPGGLGIAVTATFQGVIQDSASIIPQHASLTNAIVLRIP